MNPSAISFTNPPVNAVPAAIKLSRGIGEAELAEDERELLGDDVVVREVGGLLSAPPNSVLAPKSPSSLTLKDV